jgi:hypothetical protein
MTVEEAIELQLTPRGIVVFGLAELWFEHLRAQLQSVGNAATYMRSVV